MTGRNKSDFGALIPEREQWNDGAGIDPRSWVECVGNYALAVGYSLIFWPSFARFERYVLRKDFSVKSLRSMERATRDERRAVEAVMNHIHIADIHMNVEPNEAQLRYLGRVLKDVHETKLKRDFPALRFVVSFNDKEGLDAQDYELTFWQEAV